MLANTCRLHSTSLIKSRISGIYSLSHALKFSNSIPIHLTPQNRYFSSNSNNNNNGENDNNKSTKETETETDDEDNSSEVKNVEDDSKLKNEKVNLRAQVNWMKVKTPPKGFQNFYIRGINLQEETKKEEEKNKEELKQEEVQKEEKTQGATTPFNMDDISKTFNKFFPGQNSNKQSSTNDDKKTDQQKQNDDNNHNSGDQGGFTTRNYVFGGLSVGVLLFYAYASSTGGKEISWKEVVGLIEHGQIKLFEIVNNERAYIVLKSDGYEFSGERPEPTAGSSQRLYLSIGNVDNFEQNIEEIYEHLNLNTSKDIPVVYHQKQSLVITLLKVLPTIAIIGFWIYMSSKMGGGAGGGMGGNIFGFGKMTGKSISKEISVKTNFSNVAGLDEAKVEIMEFVEFLKDPTRFLELGAKIPKGALLVGPPGTGKTLLAKAVAGEAKVPFFSVSGSDFVEMFVGVGPSRVRDLFAQARAAAPCIVFIDEIDAIGRKRASGRMGGNDERENTLNQILVELDGFSPSKGVIILAATNRAELLDDALLRPGRFDRRVSVDAPDLKGRKQIFEIYLKRLKLEKPIEEVAKRMAARLPGFVGADIANVCNEAALIAARKGRDAVAESDFEAAIDRVIAGIEKKNRVLSPAERKIVAYHEAGHAICGWFLEYASPLVKVTIVPRGTGALGYAQYQPKDQYIYTQHQIIDSMCMTLGGRATEEVFFGKVTTGAQDDLQKVTDMAYSQVLLYGMNSNVGIVSYQKDQGSSDMSRPYSQATASMVDQEVQKSIASAYHRTIELIKSKKAEVEKVAQQLLIADVLMHEDMVALLGKRPFKEEVSYEDIIGQSSQAPEPEKS